MSVTYHSHEPPFRHGRTIKTIVAKLVQAGTLTQRGNNVYTRGLVSRTCRTNNISATEEEEEEYMRKAELPSVMVDRHNTFLNQLESMPSTEGTTLHISCVSKSMAAGEPIDLFSSRREAGKIPCMRALSPNKPRLTTQMINESGMKSLGSVNKGEVSTKISMNFT